MSEATNLVVPSNLADFEYSYMGKSTGAGALAVWMHHLTDREWIPLYNGSSYSGPAVKVHAGVIVDDLQLDAQSRGQVMVAGQCPVSRLIP